MGRSVTKQSGHQFDLNAGHDILLKILTEKTRSMISKIKAREIACIPDSWREL